MTARIFHDCDEIASMTRGEAEQSYLQLGAGRFLGRTIRVVTGEARLHWTTVRGHTLSRFRLDERFLCFTLPVFADAFTVNGHSFTRPVVVQRWGADEHVRQAKTCGYVVMAVPRRRFVADAAALAGVETEARRLPRRVVSDTGDAARRLLSALEAFGRIAAGEAGFTEMGRFSVEYRRFFGESPSDTLRR